MNHVAEIQVLYVSWRASSAFRRVFLPQREAAVLPSSIDFRPYRECPRLWERRDESERRLSGLDESRLAEMVGMNTRRPRQPLTCPRTLGPSAALLPTMALYIVKSSRPITSSRR